MTDDLAERVQRGAKLLDEKSPGWAAKVALDRLDMFSDCGCVLGQIYGLYSRGLDALGLESGMNLGFNSFRMGLLADLWRAEIRARTDGGAL